MTDPLKNEPLLPEEELEELEPSPWPKRLKVSAGVLLALLIVGYFFIGSSFFVRTFVLPAIEKSMLAKVQVSDVSLSPFSKVELADLTFTPNDGETLVSAKGALVEYSLFSIIGGTIKLNQLKLVDPQVTIIETEDGTSNLSSWLESLPPSPSASLPVLDLNNLSVEKGKVILRKQISDGGQNQIELLLNNVNIARLGQELDGALNLDAMANVVQSTAQGEETQLMLSLKLDGELGLNKDLLPQKSSINGQLKVESASGSYADMTGVTGAVAMAMVPGSIDNISLKLTRNNQAAGNIQLKGPLDFAKSEGRIVASFQDLNRQFLNLLGAFAGIDFKETLMNGSLTMTLSNGGNLIAMDAKVQGSSFSLGMGESSTPPLNLEFDTVLNFDVDGEKLVLQQLGVSVAEGQTPSITGNLAQPITFNWSGQSDSFQEPEFQLNIAEFDLGKWRDFTANSIGAGHLFGDLNLKVQQSGARMQASFDGGLKDTTVQWEEHRESGTSATVAMGLVIEDYSRFILNRFESEWLNSSGQTLASFKTSGSYVMGDVGYNVNAEGKADLALLKPFIPVDGLAIEEGGAEFSARIQSRNDELSGVVHTTLRDYSGDFAGMPFKRYTLSLSSECSMRGQQFNLGTTQLEFQEDFNDGGSIGLRGDLDMKDMKGSFTVQSTGINRYALSPFLSPYANPEDLAEVALNMKANLELDMAGQSTFKGNTSLSNLQVKDPQTDTMKNLEVALDLDLGWNSQQLDIRPSSLKLTPTTQGGNNLKLSGQLPLIPSLASKGNLIIESPSMDLTSYYDLVSGSGEEETEASADSETVTQQPAPEPAPLEVPMGELDVKLDIAKLIVRDLSVKSLKAHALWQTNKLTLKPISMTINEGPLNADLAMDFTKPNWGYALAFQADQIPLQAFADTLDPSKKGQVSGMLSGQANWSGAGLMEPALQQNLNGSMSVKYSDANIELVSPKVRLLMTPITALLRLPELLKAPINGIETNLKVEKQTLALNEFKVLSDAFQVQAAGDIPLDNVLTNSVLNLPVGFYLERSIAKKSSLIPSGAPKDTPFVKLPDFVKMEGTIGAPKTKTDKLVLSGMLMKSAAGLPLNVGEGAVNVLKDVGGFLTGDSKKSDADKDGKVEEDSGGVLEQVNPLKLFNNFRKRGAEEDQ